MDGERKRRWLDALELGLSAGLDAFAAALRPDFEPVDNQGKSERHVQAGRRGGLAKASKKVASATEKLASASPHPTPSLDGGGDGGGGASTLLELASQNVASELASQEVASNHSAAALAHTDRAVAERERLVTALPAQYAHLENPRRFYQLADEAFAGDPDRYERAVIEFDRLRDLEVLCEVDEPDEAPPLSDEYLAIREKVLSEVHGTLKAQRNKDRP